MPDLSLVSRSELAALVGSYAIAGVSVSLVCANFGVPAWIIIIAAVAMYSATGELALVAVLSAGGSTATAMVSALLVSARFGVLAAGLSSRLGSTRRPERVLAAFFVVDPPTALAMAARDDDVARSVYWKVAGMMAAGWVAGSIVGVVLESSIGNPASLGLDAVIPASLIALLGNPMRSTAGRATAIAAIAISLGLTSFLPAGLPVLAALFAVPVGLRLQERARSTAAPQPGDHPR